MRVFVKRAKTWVHVYIRNISGPYCVLGRKEISPMLLVVHLPSCSASHVCKCSLTPTHVYLTEISHAASMPTCYTPSVTVSDLLLLMYSYGRVVH